MPHPANRLNTLRVIRHETKVFDVTIKDQDGRAVKLADARLIMSIGAPGAVVLVVETGSGIEVTDAANGKARVTLSAAQTASLAVGTLRYDLWSELPGPIRHPVIRSADLVVSDGVTSFA